LQELAVVWAKNANIFSQIFRRKYLWNNIGPRLGEFSSLGRLFTLGSFAEKWFEQFGHIFSKVKAGYHDKWLGRLSDERVRSLWNVSAYSELIDRRGLSLPEK
jgi:hypothetical protein